MREKKESGLHSPTPKEGSEPEKAKSGNIPPMKDLEDPEDDEVGQPMPPEKIEQNLR